MWDRNKNGTLWRLAVFVSYVLSVMGVQFSDPTSGSPASLLNIPEFNNVVANSWESSKPRPRPFFQDSSYPAPLRRDRLLNLFFGALGKQKQGFLQRGLNKPLSDNEILLDLQDKVRSAIAKNYNQGETERRTFLPFEDESVVPGGKKSPLRSENEIPADNFDTSVFEDLPSKRQQGWHVPYGKRSDAGSSDERSAQAEAEKLLHRRFSTMGKDSSPAAGFDLFDDFRQYGQRLAEFNDNNKKQGGRDDLHVYDSSVRLQVKDALANLLKSFDDIDIQSPDQKIIGQLINSGTIPMKAKAFSDNQSPSLPSNNAQLIRSAMATADDLSDSLRNPDDALLQPSKRQQGWYTQYGKRGMDKITIEGEGSIR